MKRATISLDQQAITDLEELNNILKIPRSEIVQKALNQLKEQLIQAFTLPIKKKKYIMDELVGSIHIKGKKKVNYSQTVDDIYRRV